MEKPLSESQETWLEKWKLVTFKDGFIVGMFSALILQLGIINITTSLQNLILLILFIAGIAVSLNQAFRRKALINPTWDGIISGFGTLIGILNLILPQLSFP